MTASFEILEYSRFTCSVSLEDVQALIIVSFLVCNLVGITSQAGSVALLDGTFGRMAVVATSHWPQIQLRAQRPFARLSESRNGKKVVVVSRRNRLVSPRFIYGCPVTI